MRIPAVIVCLLSSALLLGGCATSDKAFDTTKAAVDSVVDKLPEWAGGPAQGLPPRPTDPGYAAYKRQLEGKTASKPTTHPAKPAKSTKPAEPTKPANSTDAPDPQSTGK